MESSCSDRIVVTVGEVFSDGTFIELVRSNQLLCWAGGTQSVGTIVEHGGIQYRAHIIPNSFLNSMQCPTAVGVFGNDRELHTQISRILEEVVGLPPKFQSLVSRFVLATWIIDSLEIAPTLVIEGPDLACANRLMRVLRVLCRRALSMAAVTPASICSLPSGIRFTLLIRQSAISSSLSRVLDAGATRETPILRGGELVDLYGAKVICCERGLECYDLQCPLLRVVCTRGGGNLSPVDDKTQNRIAEEFQPKLLAYRFTRFSDASANRFDASKFAMPLRPLVNLLAATTPCDAGLQSELDVLLEEENAELKSASWVDLDGVVISAVLVFCREAQRRVVYVGEIAEMAQVILKGRDEIRNVSPGEVGRRLKGLGFKVAPRDSKGVKLQLTNEVSVYAQTLAEQLDLPGARDPWLCRM